MTDTQNTSTVSAPASVAVSATTPATVQVDENPILFYCKDCAEITETIKIGGKYVYKCKRCGTKNVAFGTKKSIYGFFRIEDREKEKMREQRRQEKMKLKHGPKPKEVVAGEDLKKSE